MVKAMVTATEMKNNFGKYMDMVMNGQEVIVTKNGREVGRFIPRDATVSFLTDALTGIIRNKYDPDAEKMEALSDKYEVSD